MGQEHLSFKCADVCMWNIYYKDDTEDGACVCVSAGTHSVENLKFLLGLEDVDLQRKKTDTIITQSIHFYHL